MKHIINFFKILFLTSAVVFGVRFYRQKQNSFVISKTKNKTIKVKEQKPIFDNEDELTDRLGAIMKVVENTKEFDMQTIKTRFPKVTERTLRRDLNKLSEMKFIKKVGSTKSTKYIRI